MVALSIVKKMHPRHDIENNEISIETRLFRTFLLVFQFQTVRTSLVISLIVELAVPVLHYLATVLVSEYSVHSITLTTVSCSCCSGHFSCVTCSHQALQSAVGGWTRCMLVVYSSFTLLLVLLYY
jgi:hypothetical protein